MPASINKVPGGLLGFLGIKNGGENPTNLEPLLKTVIDLWPLYQVAYGEAITGGITVNAVGFPLGGAPLTVPANEYWWVFEYSVQSNAALGAGQILQFGPGYNVQGGGSNLFFQCGPQSNRGTTGLFASASNSEQFMLPPGAQLGVNAIELAAGPINLTGNARILRMAS